MGLFSSFFGKNGMKEKQVIKAEPQAASNRPTNSAPSMTYVQTPKNRQPVSESENDVLVLWWISKKKKGYDKRSNKFPKWFEKSYGINFNKVMSAYIRQGCLTDEENIVKTTTLGEEKLKELDYVVYVHEHAKYGLTISDFKNAENLHKVQNSDIAWGVFNSRILTYVQKGMWESLATNYGNMATLLVEEKKYEQSLDLIFAAAYLETSGMREGNELAAIMTEYTENGWKKKYLANGMPDIFLLEINNYHVTAPFMEAQKNLNLEWDDIRERFLSCKYIENMEKSLPFKYFEKEESFEIFKKAVEVGGKKGIFPLMDMNKKLKTNTPDEHSKKYFYASVQNKVAAKFG